MANIPKSITIHRGEKYDPPFVSMDLLNVGLAFGKLTSVGAKNLYVYLMGNKDGFCYQLLPAAYAKWLGFTNYITEDGKVDKSVYNKVKKQLDTGIEEMIKYGYLKQGVNETVYDFYEYGYDVMESKKKEENQPKVNSDTNGGGFNF